MLCFVWRVSLGTDIQEAPTEMKWIRTSSEAWQTCTVSHIYLNSVSSGRKKWPNLVQKDKEDKEVAVFFSPDPFHNLRELSSSQSYFLLTVYSQVAMQCPVGAHSIWFLSYELLRAWMLLCGPVPDTWLALHILNSLMLATLVGNTQKWVLGARLY